MGSCAKELVFDTFLHQTVTLLKLVLIQSEQISPLLLLISSQTILLRHLQKV